MAQSIRTRIRTRSHGGIYEYSPDTLSEFVNDAVSVIQQTCGYDMDVQHVDEAHFVRDGQLWGFVPYP